MPGLPSTCTSCLFKREPALPLYERGYDKTYLESLLRFLDWLIRLPEAAEQKLDYEIEQLKGEESMPFVTHWERRGEKRGRREGRKESLLETVLRQLKKKLGELDTQARAQIELLSVPALTELAEALLDFSEAEDLELWLARKSE